jgi:hypothetical protein
MELSVILISIPVSDFACFPSLLFFVILPFLLYSSLWKWEKKHLRHIYRRSKKHIEKKQLHCWKTHVLLRSFPKFDVIH